eukprot:m.76649 g.76649  ORF g.76649 m.76649 type:complete len:446 (-) comp19048_c0_seq1:133-1470(-)
MEAGLVDQSGAREKRAARDVDSSDTSECDTKEAVTQAFKAATLEVASLKRSGASAEEVRDAVQRLLALKQQHARLARRKKGDPRTPRPQPLDRTAAHRCYPPPTEIPRNPLDPEFTVSFSATNAADVGAAQKFFCEYGFVVFREVVDAEQCQNTVHEVFDHLQTVHPDFDRLDPTTHHLLSSTTYGLPAQQAFFTRRCLENRQSPRVLTAMRAVLGVSDILVSHDRWCVYRPTLDHPEWRTRGNVHLDVHPWRYTAGETAVEDLPYADHVDFITELNAVVQSSGPHIQGVLTLEDNREEDGGTMLVPKFHSRFNEWFDTLGSLDQNSDVGGLCWVVNRRQGGGSYKFAPADPINKLARRVTMRAGSIVLWNQETVHGSQPNRSGAWRVAQFIKAFPTTAISAERAKRRREAVCRGIADAGTTQFVSPDGMEAFGLHSDDLDAVRH